MAFLSQDSRVEVPKSRQRGLPGLRGRITSFAKLWSQCGLKQSCSPCQELFNDMWHVAWSQVNWVDSWLLVVGNQTANLTPGLSFAHNLFCRCPNEPCEPILDIYTLIAFQWYKELFKARRFDPCNRALKIRESFRESFRDSNSQHVGVHFGVWRLIPSHSLHSREHVECPRVSHLARNLATPCLGREPKARVTTLTNSL